MSESEKAEVKKVMSCFDLAYAGIDFVFDVAAPISTPTMSLFSVCQALGREGLRFTLGWTAADGLRTVDAVPDAEALFEVLALPLRDAAPEEDILAAALHTHGALHFGKTVCLCAAVSPVLEALTGAETTVLLCGTAAADCPLPTVCFTPTDLEAALRHLEL